MVQASVASTKLIMLGRPLASYFGSQNIMLSLLKSCRPTVAGRGVTISTAEGDARLDALEALADELAPHKARWTLSLLKVVIVRLKV